ncbi:MAG TPA: sensor histidine kinase KdpD [Bryobacteraceae bacterium]|nr:sensor histidine kinase KdpD [Bryobacteraceae bacterium]
MSSSRGKLKIYLGYAAGVGKTYQMLEEAQELKRHGRDIVIGYFEPHGRKDTIGKTENLELVPRRKTEYRGTVFEEMDTDAILKRHPEICVVDEFPHTNIPGSDREKRWQDVQVLLDAGIDVLTTMNVQHLESLNDQVWRITGVRVRETIPDWVMQQADQVVMVDLTPRALLNRLARGVVYPPEKAMEALKNFFQESTLVALRELALRQTAHEVEIRQVDYNSPGFETVPSLNEVTDEPPRRKESILILVTSDPSTAMLIRRGKRVADYLHADCFAVAVQTNGKNSAAATPHSEAIQKHLNFARNLHIEVRALEGHDVAKTVVEFARLNGVTQLFLARPPAGRWRELGRGDLLQQIVKMARDMQVIIVADRTQRQPR